MTSLLGLWSSSDALITTTSWGQSSESVRRTGHGAAHNPLADFLMVSMHVGVQPLPSSCKHGDIAYTLLSHI